MPPTSVPLGFSLSPLPSPHGSSSGRYALPGIFVQVRMKKKGGGMIENQVSESNFRLNFVVCVYCFFLAPT